MTNLTVPISLSDEQNDALEARVDELNSKNGSSLTKDQFLQECLMNEISKLVDQKFNAAAHRLTDMAKALPYTTREDLITELEERFAA